MSAVSLSQVQRRYFHTLLPFDRMKYLPSLSNIGNILRHFSSTVFLSEIAHFHKCCSLVAVCYYYVQHLQMSFIARWATSTLTSSSDWQNFIQFQQGGDLGVEPPDRLGPCILSVQVKLGRVRQIHLAPKSSLQPIQPLLPCLQRRVDVLHVMKIGTSDGQTLNKKCLGVVQNSG